MPISEYGPANDDEGNGNRRRAIQRVVENTNVRALIQIYIAFLLTAIVIPGGGMIATRVIGTLDKQVEKQAALENKFSALEQTVINVAGDTLRNAKNTNDRVESGEKILRDQITQNDTRLDRLTQRFDKFVEDVYKWMATVRR